MLRILLAAAALTLIAGPGGKARADLIVNGGFETGDFTGWSLANDDGANSVDAFMPQSGGYAAAFGQFQEDGLVSLTQEVTTVSGQSYSYSFWLTAEAYSGVPDEFRASFGGQTLLDLVDVNPFAYTLYTFAVTATSSSSLVEFDSINDFSYFDLDNVGLAAVPEPSSLALFGLGLGCVVGRSVRRLLRRSRGGPDDLLSGPPIATR